MTLETRLWKPGEYVETTEDAVAYIEGALEEVGPEHLPMAIRAIAESKGMAALARKAGLTRAGLYRALGENGDPKMSTLNAILDALDLRLSVAAKRIA